MIKYIICVYTKLAPPQIYRISELAHNPRCLEVFGPVSDFVGRKFSPSYPWWSTGESFHSYCSVFYPSLPVRLFTSLLLCLRMNVEPHLILANVIYGFFFHELHNEEFNSVNAHVSSFKVSHRKLRRHLATCCVQSFSVCMV